MRRRLGWMNVAVLGLYTLAPSTAHAQHTLFFSTSDPGQTKSVAEWGVDTAWPSYDNVRQSIASIGVNNVDVVRLTFHPAHPLTDNGNGTYSLSDTAKGFINNQLALAAMAGSKPLTLMPGEFGPNFDATHWLRTIKATQEYINSRPGFASTQIKSIEVFNEPDFWVGQGSPADLNNLITQLKGYAVFQNTAFPAGSALNSNNGRFWYDNVPAATQGSSHLLGGSMTNYVNFMEHVKATGKPFVNPELHSLGEAIVGAEHGMAGGIFWGDALRARGLFARASDGKRLGYHEDLGRQSAAAVYRAPDGKIYAFAGGLERFGQATAYRFVSTDKDVYFNGIPVREYMLQTKFDEVNAANPAGNDFENYGSWSNQGAYAEVDTAPGLPALDGYRWKIVNAQTGQVMEVAGGGTDDGATIRSAADANGLNQKWNIVRTRNGYFHLFNANSGRTAEVAFGSLDNGAGVRQFGTADNQIQQWYIEDAGNGSFHIRNAYSNKYLSANASTGNTFQFDNTGSNVQKWRFVLSNPNLPAKAHYGFQGNANSSTGAQHGVATGSPTYGNGPAGQGQALNLDGVNDYVTLPGGVASNSDLTVSTYVKWDGGNAWQRIFDFGNSTSSYMFLTPRSGDNTMRFAITTGAGEQILDTSPLPVGQWVHLTLTLGGNTGVLFVDGKPRVAGQILLDPSHVNPTLNYIGKSQFADPLFDGMIDDFRVFDYALDPGQAASLVFHRWTGELNSSWTTAAQAGAKNWQHQVAAEDYANGNGLLFDDYAFNFNVNLADAAAVTPGSVQFDNTRNHYTLNGPGTIAGSGSLTKNGGGTLTINNANAYTGGTVVNAGTLVLGHSNAINAGRALTVATGATARARAGLPAAVDVSSLALAASGPTGGTLDLTDNALVVRHTNASAALVGHTAVNGLTRNALNEFAWNQPGITSSTVVADIAAGIPSAVGILLNNDGGGGTLFYGDGTALPQFEGRSVDANSVLVKYTLLGDGDLNGTVDSVDFALFQAGYTGAAPYVGFAFGDYDYNGVIDSVDFGLFQAGYQYSQSNPTPAMVAFAELHHLSLVAVAVPEPATLGLLALAGTAGLVGRRRSR